MKLFDFFATGRRAFEVLAVSSGLLLALAGCSETQFLVHTAKQAKSASQTPAQVGSYKVGRPYQIKGVWYYPKDEPDYEETGIASWYGPGFHGKATANGEVFDENEVSAAHRTLPMPSVVRVTNLGNGRSIVVRVNDRGPFAHGRILDLSRRAAQLLGFERDGTARVRVTLLQIESEQARAISRGDAAPRALADAGPAPAAAPSAAVQVSTVAPPSGATPTRTRRGSAVATVRPTSAAATLGATDDATVLSLPVERTALFVQAGSFQNLENANRLTARLSPLGRSDIQRAEVAGQVYYRVRLGPLSSVEQADMMLARVIDAGYPGSQIVVD